MRWRHGYNVRVTITKVIYDYGCGRDYTEMGRIFRFNIGTISCKALYSVGWAFLTPLTNIFVSALPRLILEEFDMAASIAIRHSVHMLQ